MTIFDKILAGEIPAKVVYEDEHVLAFHDVNPQAPVHILVIPKHKVERFQHLPEEETMMVGRLFQTAATVARQEGLEEEGYRVVINNGKQGQQTVEYIHLHLLGKRQMQWPPG